MDNVEGRFSEVIQHLIQELRQDLIRTRSKHGLKRLAELGFIPCGRVARGYSYTLIPLGESANQRYGRKPEIDENVAPYIIRAFEMRATNANLFDIAAATGLYPAQSGSWSRLFRNRAYIGEFEFAGVVYTNVYPAIIDLELFERCARTMDRSVKGGRIR